MRLIHYPAILGLAALLSLPAALAGDVVDIGSRRELFVDHLLVDRLVGASLRLGTPLPGGVAVRFNDPVEDDTAFYTTIFKDGDIYRMYYRGALFERKTTCYAESRDGINWTKPDLGLVSIDGSTRNHVILPEARQFVAFIDGRPGVPASERYKGTSRGPVEPNALVGFLSGDGIRWRMLRDEPIVPKVLINHFDSQNVMFWSEVEEQYVLYARHMEGGRRATARSTSKDFINWTPQVLMSYSDTGTTTPSHHLYTNQTQPYFRAPHIYISLPARIIFADPRHVKTEGDKQLASRRQRLITPELRDFVKENMPLMGTAGTGDHSDGVLLTTRAGSTVYDFTFRESFVRPGIGVNNWTTRTNYPACGIVPTGDGEMSFYVQRNYGQKGTAYLERMTLRLDGFASLNAPYQGGEMVTKPLRFKGNRLEINYATSAAGSLRIEIQDPKGQPIPGFTLEECPEIIGDEIERNVAWKGDPDLRSLSGKPVRIRVVLKDADLYSIRFH